MHYEYYNYLFHNLIEINYLVIQEVCYLKSQKQLLDVPKRLMS